ncbi:MAG: hypothetical protein RL219_2539 [Actinomycetota bacterium]
MNLDDLRTVVGPANVLVDDDLRAGFEVDWTRRFSGRSFAVVRPADVEEVARLMEWCARERVGVIPQGGNTGLVGGSVPVGQQATCIVLSLQRLNQIFGIDLLAGNADVGAGVTLGDLETRLLGTGWEFGVDLSARSSATLGGMVATNAGGTRVMRDGTMRTNLLGAQAVLADASVVSHMSGLVKDNTGYDWPGLLCGSEGTLGVITRCLLRLVPARPDRVAVAVQCATWADAVLLAGTVRRQVPGIEVIEAVDAAGVRCAASELGIEAPVAASGVTLLLVWAGVGEPPPELVDAVADHPHVVGPPRALLAVRDRQSEAIARRGIPHKFDVSVPLAKIADFVHEVESSIDSGLELFVFGHLGDGNLHVNVVGAQPDDDAIDARILAAVARANGSISAEHGIGRAKAPWLHLTRSSADIALMRRIKAALDPDNLLNPGVLFPIDPGRSAPT